MRSVVLVAVLAAACGRPKAGADDGIRVAAAADLTFAFAEVGKAFTARTAPTSCSASARRYSWPSRSARARPSTCWRRPT